MEVPRLPPEQLSQTSRQPAENSELVRSRVEVARERQLARAGRPNAALGSREIEQTCSLEPEAQRLIHRALEQLGLSARAYHRILKVARTIADLEGERDIQSTHVSEAIGYRRLDRNL